MLKRWFVIGGLVFVFLTAAGVGGWWYVRRELAPLPAGDAVEITLPKGASFAEVATILEEHGLIRNAQVFTWYVKLKAPEDASRIKAGVYRLAPGETPDDVLLHLVRGDVYVETDTFTIPEGWTVEEMAELLEQKGIVRREDFLQAANKTYEDVKYMDKIPEDRPGRKYLLEGYLFPDTYAIAKGESAESIVRRMLKRFSDIVGDDFEQKALRLGLTFDEAVTLASMIEKEAVLDEERPKIAGVFYNRLRERWRLESCATVEYVLETHKARLTLKDLEVDDPYNTYRAEGLPPGPIASPGKASLLAAVAPEEHDFFFFVAKEDGSGGHYFSKTYEEHLKQGAKSRGSF
ncbi:MAG: protein YceG like [Candidatus Carbobacillus altaicus]|uniref:Endolytic murein transglycosylase n=1 Tax=Candidatus Carbonibacillus altaicus TaxID=2163959 RepID=A0A2R6Y1C4_9BACL|nr:MAG: protein YceG like [Candidatus Carbobacillus altaicus]